MGGDDWKARRERVGGEKRAEKWEMRRRRRRRGLEKQRGTGVERSLGGRERGIGARGGGVSMMNEWGERGRSRTDKRAGRREKHMKGRRRARDRDEREKWSWWGQRGEEEEEEREDMLKEKEQG